MADQNNSVDPFFNPKQTTKDSNQLNIDSLTNPETPIVISPTVVAENPVEDNIPQAVPQTQIASPKQAVNAPQILAKQGTKISFRTFAIGCGVFFLLFLILVIIGLYSAISNPESLSNLGLDISTVKSILLIFTVLFFGLLFFVGFGFTALNAYRFFTLKEGSKVRYIVGFLIGVFLLLGSIGLGFISYNQINAITEEKQYNTNDLIIPFIQIKKYDDGDSSLPYSRVYIGTQGLPLIAPTYMDMQINRQIADSLGFFNLQLTKLTLDCGNGQNLINDPGQISAQLFFQGSCMYLKKGQYNVKLNYSYFDSQQGVEVSRSVERAATIDIATDYGFNIDGSDWKLNDSKNEVILGTAPTKMLIDAQKIFTDLNIPNIQIQWDMDGNGTVDKQNRVSFTYYFDQARLYTSYMSIPLNVAGLPSQIWYLTRFRVNAGDVPTCELQTTKLGETNYELLVKIDDKGTDISEYNIDIIDNQTDEILSSLKSDKEKFEYMFANGKSYRVRGYFTTTEGKRGSCEANSLLDIGYNSYSTLETVSVIGPNDSVYSILSISGDNRLEADSIILSDIPTTVKISIDKIVPDISNPQISVLENGVVKNPSKTREYIFKVDSEDKKEIRITVADDKGKSVTKVYNIKIERQNLIAKLKASKTVGFDPLIVEFDASVTKLNDPTDEVVYFTWEFGDGEVRKNTSVGKIVHTYKFDAATENGEFQPKVTLKTKKGVTQTISYPEKIIVKRQIKTFDILLPSHPAQLAKPGDTVELALQADGKVTGVSWDFGNGKKLQGQGREFAETSMKYDEGGIYEIFATVEFSDHPPVTQSIKLKVE